MKSLFARKPPEPVKRKVSLNDPERLAALRRLKIMGTPPEESLDRLTRIAAKVVGAPVALLTLVDAHHQYFKSAYGLPEALDKNRQTPLTHSFCQHVVLDQAAMIVSDARLDPRLKDNPAIESVGVISYAGMPVFAPNGEPLGSFCVMDRCVRHWEPDQLSILKDLAATVMAELEAKELANALVNQEETRVQIGEEISEEVMESVRALVKDLNGVLKAKTIGPAISQAISSAQKIGVRLGDLSDVASFDSETISPTQHRHELGTLMNSAAKDVQSLADEMQVKIKISLPGNLPLVLASAPVIERVLRILLRQAIRFSESEDVVKMWATEEDDMVACYISNIAQSSDGVVKSAWSENETVLPTPRHKVGLAFCGRAIEDHGGTIGVVTLPDGSSAMRFTLMKIGTS